MCSLKKSYTKLNLRIFEANVDFMSLEKKDEVRVTGIRHMSFLEIHFVAASSKEHIVELNE
jgi:hypothetical protein